MTTSPGSDLHVPLDPGSRSRVSSPESLHASPAPPCDPRLPVPPGSVSRPEASGGGRDSSSLSGPLGCTQAGLVGGNGDCLAICLLWPEMGCRLADIPFWALRA